MRQAITQEMEMVYTQMAKFFKDLHQSRCYKISDFPQFCRWFKEKYNIELSSEGEKIYGKHGFVCLISYYDLEW